jgi:hypothetical protein
VFYIKNNKFIMIHHLTDHIWICIWYCGLSYAYIADESNGLVILRIEEDWKNEWTGEDSDGGTAVTTNELQDAIHHWLGDITVRGHIMSSTDLQGIIAIWLLG